MNLKGQGRKISDATEIDEQLLAWLLERRETSHIAVSTQMIHLKAMSLIRPVNPGFKASSGWLTKFMMRLNLVLRSKTNIAQTLPKDLESKIVTFHHKIRSIREESDFPYELIANMDETPIYFDTVPAKTVNRKGAKTVHCPYTNHWVEQATSNSCYLLHSGWYIFACFCNFQRKNPKSNSRSDNPG